MAAYHQATSNLKSRATDLYATVPAFSKSDVHRRNELRVQERANLSYRRSKIIAISVSRLISKNRTVNFREKQ